MNSPKHTDSYYAATADPTPELPALKGEASCDVCVIGGGYTGLSTALHLVEQNYEVILLEAERMGWGASGRNGGQLGTGQRQSQDEVEQMVGEDDARRLWEMAECAKATVKERIRRHDIRCDLKPGILHAAHKPSHAKWLADYVDVLRTRYQYEHIRSVSREEMTDMLGTTVYHGGSLDTDAGHLHPLNYALGLAKAAHEAGARLFEDSRVLTYDRAQPTTIRTSSGVVKARYLVLACNGYLDTLEPRISSTIMPINNFVLATEPLGTDRARALIRDDVAVADTKFVIDYYRLSADKRLLFGGGENYTRRFPADLKRFVRKYMLRVYPQLSDTRIDYAWGGTLAVTLKRMPHFGRLKPNVFFAHGFSGHGVAMATLAGELIAEAVSGTAERFDVFMRLPTPRFPGGTLLRWPGLVVGMLYYSLRDKL